MRCQCTILTVIILLFRSLLADVVQTDTVKGLCELLVIASREAANACGGDPMLFIYTNYFKIIKRAGLPSIACCLNFRLVLLVVTPDVFLRMHGFMQKISESCEFVCHRFDIEFTSPILISSSNKFGKWAFG
jgi:hypothetical protein